jgi:epidermal growth factor receptor substrate 15
MRQINAEMAQLRPVLEKLRSDARHEKGMVSISKKQLEKGETERDAAKAEVADLTKSSQDSARSPPAESSSYGASPAASTQSTNPFFRKSPQQSFDNTMSPGGFARPQSKEGNKFDNFFAPSFSSSPSTSGPAPPVTFRENNAVPPSSEESVTSSDTNNFPTPSASPRPFEPPVPALGQFTSRDLGTPAASTATSVRVETPSSRYDGADTPTNVGGSSPHAQGFQRPEHSRSDTQTSTGAAMFDRNTNASPVASLTSDTSSRPKQAGFFGSAIPGAFPENTTPLQPDLTGTSGFSSGSKQSGSRSDPFSFPGQPSRTATNKSDFDQAFATVGSSSVPQARQVTGSSTNGSLNEPSGSKFKTEFPPIELKEDESDTDSEPGFDDDFTQASPGHNRKTSQPQFGETRPSKDTPSNSFFTTQPSASELPTPGAQKSPPAYEQSGPGSSGVHGSNDFPPEFGGLLPSRENPLSPQSQTSQSPERAFASPASGTQGHALFGGASTSKSASTAPTTAFSGSPPPTTSTPVSTVPSDAYHTAGSYPSGSTDKSSSNHPTTSNRNSQPTGDDFDSGFDDLTEAKEDDVRDDDDFMFGSQHNESFDEFNPAFDSPAMSKSGTMASERTPTASGQATTFGDSSFGDFESNFSSKPSQSASASASKPAGQDDWETMMQSISGPSGGNSSTLSKSAAGIGFGDGPDLAFSGVAAPMAPPLAPEAPTPPKLGRSLTQASEHDVGFVKDLMGMGYARPVVVAALEKYDYDFDKVCALPLELIVE